MTLSVVELYTDGSSIKNPGLSGYGFIVKYTVDDPDNPSVPKFVEVEKNQGYRFSTNNRMELMAAINGVRCVLDLVRSGVIKGCTQLNLFSDSEYLCNAVNKKWINKWMDNNWMTSGFGGKSPSPIKNRDLWEEILKTQSESRELQINLTFNWVKGHETNEMNNRADELAVAASTGINHIIDEVFEGSSGMIPKVGNNIR